ncbi:MAG TPA: hypothetical protein VFB28_13305 [Terriglobales bacterium]|nr:hypothetical protein [Terriglobales bacterium]
MSTYLPDTNVVINYGKDLAAKARIDRACAAGSKFVIAPPVLTELTVGVVKGGATYFAQNKIIFEWLRSQSANILDLPRPFMGKVLGFPSKKSDVDVGHHIQRIELVTQASDFANFLKRKDAAGSLWPDIEKSAEVHEQQLDKEFAALQRIAKLKPGSYDLAAQFAKTFKVNGKSPDPNTFRSHFSAAMEYAETTIMRIRGGANPRKNDPGRYGDFQLFFYLADPRIQVLTCEDFSSDTKNSPQRSRIVKLESLP